MVRLSWWRYTNIYKLLKFPWNLGTGDTNLNRDATCKDPSHPLPCIFTLTVIGRYTIHEYTMTPAPGIDGGVSSPTASQATLGNSHSPHNGTQPEKNSTESKRDTDSLETETLDYPHAFKLTFIIVALVLSVFLVALDMTIVATAIPRITDEFHSLDQVGWYGSAFFLTLGAFQSTWGKAYKYFPLKLTFLLAIGVFELGSLICAVAQDSTTLIIGRAIAGKSSTYHCRIRWLTVSRHGWRRYRFRRVHYHCICGTTSAKARIYRHPWCRIRMR